MKPRNELYTASPLLTSPSEISKYYGYYMPKCLSKSFSLEHESFKISETGNIGDNIKLVIPAGADPDYPDTGSFSFRADILNSIPKGRDAKYCVSTQWIFKTYYLKCPFQPQATGNYSFTISPATYQDFWNKSILPIDAKIDLSLNICSNNDDSFHFQNQSANYFLNLLNTGRKNWAPYQNHNKYPHLSITDSKAVFLKGKSYTLYLGVSIQISSPLSYDHAFNEDEVIGNVEFSLLLNTVCYTFEPKGDAYFFIAGGGSSDSYTSKIIKVNIIDTKVNGVIWPLPEHKLESHGFGDLSVDMENNILYWSMEDHSVDSGLGAVGLNDDSFPDNLPGLPALPPIPFGIFGMATEPGKSLYYLNPNIDASYSLNRYDINTKKITSIVGAIPYQLSAAGNTTFMRGLALDLKNRNIYYTEWDAPNPPEGVKGVNTCLIKYVSMDTPGLAQGRLFIEPTGLLAKMASNNLKIDAENDMIYWLQESPRALGGILELHCSPLISSQNISGKDTFLYAIKNISSPVSIGAVDGDSGIPCYSIDFINRKLYTIERHLGVSSSPFYRLYKRDLDTGHNPAFIWDLTKDPNFPTVAGTFPDQTFSACSFIIPQ